MKHEYLVVYDYGTGGLWAILEARSEAEIAQKFPRLEVISSRPGWMTPEMYETMVVPNRFDIDEPKGWLKMLAEGLE